MIRSRARRTGYTLDARSRITAVFLQLVCSGNGQCSCGHCACNQGFTGATCAVEQPADENVDILPADDDQSADATTVADAQGQTNAAASLLNVHVVLSALTLLLLAVLFR